MLPRTKIYIGGAVTTERIEKILELLEKYKFHGSLRSKDNHSLSKTCSINEVVKRASNQEESLCVTCSGMEIPNEVLTAIIAVGLHYRLEIECTKGLIFVLTYIDGQEASGSVLDGNPIISEKAIRKAHESRKIPDIIKNMERLSMLPEKFVVLESAREQLAHEKNRKSARSKAHT